MNISTQAGGAARSHRLCYAATKHHRIAPGESRKSLEFARSAGESAAEVIFWVGVSARKTWTAAAQNGGDIGRGGSLAQQLLGDPFVGDAPIRVWKAFADLQSTQPIGIDLRGRRVASRFDFGGAHRRQ